MGTTNILDLNNRVDDLEKSYPANKVVMTGGGTVEDRLNANKLGDAVNLTFETNYTALTDGYFIGVASAGSGNYVTLNVGGVNMTRAYSGGQNFGGYTSTFVKKGMTIFFSGNSSSAATAIFRPLT